MDKINTFFLLAISIIVILGVLFVLVAGSSKSSSDLNNVLNQKEFVVKSAVGNNELIIPCNGICKQVLNECPDNFGAEIHLMNGKPTYSYSCKTYSN